MRLLVLGGTVFLGRAIAEAALARVDTSGYVPRVARRSAEQLAESVGCYAFVSSISAHADFSAPIDERSQLASPVPEDEEDVQRAYGPLKAACERVVRDAFAERALVVRPGPKRERELLFEWRART